MINRTIVRTKVVLDMFAYFNDEGQTRLTAEKTLMRHFADTYNLYFLLLELVGEITTYAEERIEEARDKAQVMHTEYNANLRFVENRFAKQLFHNHTLRKYIEEQHLSWDEAHDVIGTLYKQIVESEMYAEYMDSQESSYEADKTIWRKIFTNIIADNEDLQHSLEDLEVSLDATCWATDMNVVISYIIKTIKRFREDNESEQPLLEMFDQEDEVEFAEQLLRSTIKNGDKYAEMIAEKLHNWDADRVAYMDMVILKVALAEIFTFPEIPIQVTLNEYLEIAREYSTDNSPQFINGLLDQIVKDENRKGKLMKAAVLKGK